MLYDEVNSKMSQISCHTIKRQGMAATKSPITIGKLTKSRNPQVKKTNVDR